jgi:hypothetical protein
MSRRWTAEQYAQAVALQQAGKSFAEIGVLLGKTADAVRKRLGKGDKLSVPEAWTEDEKRALASYVLENRSTEEIARFLGRSRAAVKAKINKEQLIRPGARRIRPPAAICEPIPLAVIADRDRRKLIEPRDLTAWLFGDPLPGYSALDGVA